MDVTRNLLKEQSGMATAATCVVLMSSLAALSTYTPESEGFSVNEGFEPVRYVTQDETSASFSTLNLTDVQDDLDIVSALIEAHTSLTGKQIELDEELSSLLFDGIEELYL